MADIQRPDFEILWASQGDRTQPNETKLQVGWEVEIPPRQVENWIQNRQDTALAYILQKGIPEWSINTDYYPKKSFVQYDGRVYLSKTYNKDRRPDVNPLDWELATVIESDLSEGAFRDVNSSGNNLVDNSRIVQSTGASVTNIMSQKAVTDALGAAVPVGTLLMWPANNPPSGYLICDGRAVSRSTYANLFNVIGTIYGAGNGTSTFNLPDFRDYFPRGKSDGRDIGSKQQDDLKSHTHGATSSSAGEHNHSASTGSSGSHSHSASTGNAGSHTHTRGSMNIVGDFRGGSRTGFSGGSGVFRTDSGGTSTRSASSTQSESKRVTFDASRNWTGSTSSSGSHSHSVSVSSAGAHTHSVSVGNAGAHTHSISVSNTGGSETRPKNIAVNFIIKT